MLVNWVSFRLLIKQFDTDIIITCEEHQVGGFGNIVAGVLASTDLKKPLNLEMTGVNDRFGESGQPWELMKVFGLVAECIVSKTKKLLSIE